MSLRILAPLALLLLAGCSTPQRIYSLQPVDRGGTPLPLEQVERMGFEDGSLELVGERQDLMLLEDRLALRETESGEILRAWPLAQVEWVEWPDERGRPRRAEALTPDDLHRFETLPRVESVLLKDGTLLRSDGDGERFRWSLSALELELVRGQERLESLPLDDVQTVTLHQQSLLGSTLRSPAFWVASVAATGLFIAVMRDPDDETTADR